MSLLSKTMVLRHSKNQDTHDFLAEEDQHKHKNQDTHDFPG